MIKCTKAAVSAFKTGQIQQILNFYYANPPVPLNSVNDFTFLVAVVLSAQTTDGIVNLVTKELFNVASTPHAMAQMTAVEVQRIIQPIGLANKKAEFLVGLSQKLVNEYDGKVPCTYADLESLPGVGHKTASVVMSQVFGIPAIAVDTHVHRLALRWGLSKEAKNVNKVQVDLCSVFPMKDWNKLHLQMIYFGREFCTAKNHENAECPICCWVHRATDSAKEMQQYCSAEWLSRFASKPRSKGIVYYSERTAQLQQVVSMVKPEEDGANPFAKFMDVVEGEAKASVAVAMTEEVAISKAAEKVTEVTDVTVDTIVKAEIMDDASAGEVSRVAKKRRRAK